MNAFILIGASGFGREVMWVCRRAGLTVVGFCDDASGKRSGELAGLPLLGRVEDAAARHGSGTAFHVAVGDNRARMALFERALAVGWVPASVVDPSAVCAPYAVIGAGTYVGIGSVVSTGAVLGRGVIVNHHVTVGHDAAVGDFADLCPGVRLSGGCRVGEGGLLGSNAVTRPGVRIGAWATLGMGTAALRDVPDAGTLIHLASRRKDN